MTCTACDIAWDLATARFCGRCGTRLAGPRAQTKPSPGASGWLVQHRVGLLVGLAIIAVVAVGASGAAVSDLITFGANDANGDVELPDREETESFGELGSLTPEQRETLERSDPDRLRCEPRGCEAWRLELDEDTSRVAVASGWVAVLDGSTLRVRSTSIGVAGQASAFPARAERASTSSVVGSGSGTAIDGDDDNGNGGNDNGANDDSDGVTNSNRNDDDPAADPPVGPGRNLDVSALLDEVVDGDVAGPPDRMELAEDGTVILQWPHRLVAIADEVRWDVTPPTGPYWYLEVQGDRVIALSDDSDRASRSPVGRAQPSGPVRVTGYDLTDGTDAWTATSVAPRNFVDAGLIVTTSDGALERIALEDGRSEWRRSLTPDERVQVTSGPWLVVGGQATSTLVDVQSGEEITTRDTSALVTPIQRMGDQWVALWIDGSASDRSSPSVVLVALDAQGDERWRTPLTQLEGGACCPAAIPWLDGTIAVFDSGADPPVWITVDAATGLQLDANDVVQPLPPLAPEDSRAYVASDAPGRVIQEGDGGVGLLSTLGSATVTGPSDIEVVSLDPLVVAQGRQVMGVRPVPQADGSD